MFLEKVSYFVGEQGVLPQQMISQPTVHLRLKVKIVKKKKIIIKNLKCQPWNIYCFNVMGCNAIQHTFTPVRLGGGLKPGEEEDIFPISCGCFLI